MHACHFTQSLENFCHACGMNDTLQDTDNAWVSIAIAVFVINNYSIIYAIDIQL